MADRQVLRCDEWHARCSRGPRPPRLASNLGHPLAASLHRLGGMNPKDGHDVLTHGVQFVGGVGPDRAGLFGRLGVGTVEDLLFLLPREYQDLRRRTLIGWLSEGGAAFR